jgi:hypothetical protein
MDPLVYFIVTMLSLAVINSMLYNPRRLETIGYALSIAFLQQLMMGNEDVFLICSQFPLYVSPKDKEPSPDRTLPDSEAIGVYVDHALLFPSAQSNTGGPKLAGTSTGGYVDFISILYPLINLDWQAHEDFHYGIPTEQSKPSSYPFDIILACSSTRGEETGSYPPPTRP